MAIKHRRWVLGGFFGSLIMNPMSLSRKSYATAGKTGKLECWGGVAGRHMSNRRRGSSPAIRVGEEFSPARYARRRRAVTTSDHKSCALIQTRLKLGDIMVSFVPQMR
ncbi:hypothetical protein NQ318_006807 [Aromia moschata]|uniref:Secreted protein n=1 Tax=Aromia moschata TaxID=1265417 RepID=A0AAV8XQV0_9CUCU|nr:hypothetical protein NQ318_006807 [Aromia moschata]